MFSPRPNSVAVHILRAPNQEVPSDPPSSVGTPSYTDSLPPSYYAPNQENIPPPPRVYRAPWMPMMPNHEYGAGIALPPVAETSPTSSIRNDLEAQQNVTAAGKQRIRDRYAAVWAVIAILLGGSAGVLGFVLGATALIVIGALPFAALGGIIYGIIDLIKVCCCRPNGCCCCTA